jgi:hypothetical protein
VTTGIEPQPACGRARRLPALEQRAHAHDQRGERERLGEEVVAAGVERRQLVGEVAAGGEEQHRRVDAVRPQRPTDIAAVGVRQADVQHEEIRDVFAEDPDRVTTRSRQAHLEVLGLERTGQDRPQVLIVFTDPDSHEHRIACLPDRNLNVARPA